MRIRRTPPEGKSVIWCASFQFAWNRLKDDVVKEPVRLAVAQSVTDRLNASKQTEDDIEANHAFAAAGFVNSGIVERIQKEMSRRFPDVPRPEFDPRGLAAVAYGYLAVSSKFDIPYFENDEEFTFIDSAGKKTAVTSFGIRKKDDYAYHQLRDQVQILYCPENAVWRGEVREFILDLCKTSRPYQVVVARIDRKPTLAETVAEAERKIASQPKDGDSKASHLWPRDTVLVPNMAWRITHRFKELEGPDKGFLNSELRGLYIHTAMQTIQFRLDRSGADLASESRQVVKPGVSNFHVNRPFLLYLKKRGGKHPFFVMWVDNAELLQKE